MSHLSRPCIGFILLAEFFGLRSSLHAGELEKAASEELQKAVVPDGSSVALAVADGDSADLYVDRGQALFKKRAYSRALEQLTLAVALRPDSARIKNLLGLVYAFAQKPGEGVVYFRKAIELEPDNGDYHAHLGNAYMLLVDYEGAKTAYGRALELGLKNPKPHFDLGLISERENRLSDARGHYEKASAMLPNHASAYLRLGVVAERQGDNGRAVARYRSALTRNPYLAAAHYRIAQRYLEDGRRQLADIHLQRFRDLKAAPAP